METAFFILSKLIWALIRPETLLLVLLFGAFVWHRHRPALSWWLLATGLGGFVIVAIFPLGDLLLAPLERQFPPEPPVREVTNIVVLGGGESSDLSRAGGQPQLNAAGERLLAGIALARRFPDSKLVFTGGSDALVQGPTREASVAQRVFLDAGIAPYRLRIESTSRNTAENARLARDLIEEGNSGVILLVTSARHMPRAMATFCAAGWENLVAWPVDYRSSGFSDRIAWSLARHLDDLNMGVKEWVGLLAYRWTGRLADQKTYCGPPKGP